MILQLWLNVLKGQVVELNDKIFKINNLISNFFPLWWPAGSTFKTLEWYHPQAFTYCTACDPQDETKCLANACPQGESSEVTSEGHCGCKQGAAASQPRKGAKVIRSVCNAMDNIEESTRKESCIQNRFQLRPEEECNSCSLYNETRCKTCAIKGAEVYRYTAPQGGVPSKLEASQTMLKCACPRWHHYDSVANECICSTKGKGQCVDMKTKGKRWSKYNKE